jgi:hypothetical protein
MIAYVCTRQHAYTAQWLLQEDGWGHALANQMRIYPYDRLLQPGPQPQFDVYIFTDLERLDVPTRQTLAQIWEQLSQLPEPPRLINHPLRVKRRLDLLNSLHQAGINTFDAYPILAHGYPVPRQFPVFIRDADEHDGPMGTLLNNQAELEQAIDTLRVFKEWRPSSIVVEFINTANALGHYQKYGAFRVGDAIISNHIQENSHWMVKQGLSGLSPDLLEREVAYMKNNVYAPALMEVFQLANIDFGRIDYAVVNDRIQVFEINTNPTFFYPKSKSAPERLENQLYVSGRLIEAFRALEPSH